MFDLGADKLLLVALLVGLIAGPERLVTWARTATSYLGRFRQAFQEGRSRVRDELDDIAPDWRDLDPRKVDPRRIIRDALISSPAPTARVEAPATPSRATPPPAAIDTSSPSAPVD